MKTSSRRAWVFACPLLLLTTTSCRNDGPLVLHGAGATLPHPLYARWGAAYAAKTPGVRVNYQPVGSGAGVRQIEDGVVDFGATDEPMTDAQVARLEGDVVQVPLTIGAVAIAYHLEEENAAPLRLTGELVADVFRGKVTRWNDARLLAQNPDRALPDAPILVVHRADGSGTSATLTTYLARVSPGFRDDVGAGASPPFPVGVGARGNEGVASFVRTTPHAFGYVELAHARAAHLAQAAIQNRRGAYVSPDVDGIARAAMATSIAQAPTPSLVDTDAEGAYPIAALSYVIVPRDTKNRARGVALARFLWWALHEGQALSPELAYARLPEHLVARGEHVVRDLRAAGAPALEER